MFSNLSFNTQGSFHNRQATEGDTDTSQTPAQPRTVTSTSNLPNEAPHSRSLLGQARFVPQNLNPTIPTTHQSMLNESSWGTLFGMSSNESLHLAGEVDDLDNFFDCLTDEDSNLSPRLQLDGSDVLSGPIPFLSSNNSLAGRPDPAEQNQQDWGLFGEDPLGLPLEEYDNDGLGYPAPLEFTAAGTSAQDQEPTQQPLPEPIPRRGNRVEHDTTPAPQPTHIEAFTAWAQKLYRTPLYILGYSEHPEAAKQPQRTDLENKFFNAIAAGSDPKIESEQLPMIKRALQQKKEGVALHHWHGGEVTHGETKMTVLHRVAETGAGKFTKALIDHKANINAVDLSKITPLHNAVTAPRANAALVLINQPKINLQAKEEQGKTPLHIAVSRSNDDVFQKLLRGFGEKLPTLVDIKDHQGFTPIMTAIHDYKPERAEALLPFTNKASATNKQGETLLHIAISSGIATPNTLAQTVKSLLGHEKKILVDHQNAQKQTALHYCLERQQVSTPAGKEAIATVTLELLKHNASLTKQDKLGNNPLHILANQGADSKVTEELLKKADQKSLNQVNKDGETPLHIALKRGRLDIVKEIVHRTHLDITDDQGNAPLHIAVKKGYTELFDDLSASNKKLLNQRGEDGRTPLHLAYLHGKTDLIPLMLAQGANPDAIDDEGCFPDMLAN